MLKKGPWCGAGTVRREKKRMAATEKEREWVIDVRHISFQQDGGDGVRMQLLVLRRSKKCTQGCGGRIAVIAVVAVRGDVEGGCCCGVAQDQKKESCCHRHRGCHRHRN